MKQVLQNVGNGATEIVDIPVSQVKPGHLLIQTRVSLISSGTEKMAVQSGQSSLLGKALNQPQKVVKAIEMMQSEGLAATLKAVEKAQDHSIAMGYCNVGEVIAVGRGVTGWQVGDRVVSNGPHAEVVCVPQNLCAKVPEGVSDELSVFTVMGAISLQGLRLLGPTMGETFVVMGLGVLGLLAVQLLKANGCQVMAMDFDKERLQWAEKFGAEVISLSDSADPVRDVMSRCQQRGVDGVLITAATTSSEPMHQAAQMCRKRGRIILVGVTGLELQRNDFYEKELTFQVSCSYGPGRYDSTYELEGQDYPLGFVRWTEQRNFEAILGLMKEGKINAEPFVSHRFSVEEIKKAYDLILQGGSSLGVLLEYEKSDKTSVSPKDRFTLLKEPQIVSGRQPVVGVIGSGNYATHILLPAIQKGGGHLKTVVSQGGMSGFIAGRKFQSDQVTTDVESLWSDPQINTIVIATQHSSHSDLVTKALLAGKNVFVEKPVAMDAQGLASIQKVIANPRGSAPLLMVGFNRRFAPHIREMKKRLDSVSEPKSVLITVNAGSIPKDHWTQKWNQGGGRLIGEGCHFVDLARHLVGHSIHQAQAHFLGQPSDGVITDKVTMVLDFSDGSQAVINYWSHGHKSYPKERIEVFTAGRVFQLNNFVELRGYGWPGFKKQKLWSQDKGQMECMRLFLESVEKGGSSPIPWDEIAEVAAITFELDGQAYVPRSA